MYICWYITIYLTQYRNMYFDFLYLVLILSFPLTRSYNQLKMIIKLSHIALVPLSLLFCYIFSDLRHEYIYKIPSTIASMDSIKLCSSNSHESFNDHTNNFRVLFGN